MPNNNQQPTKPDSPPFDRVATILEQARANVVRSVNNEMVIAYWLVVREIVEEEQQGEKRAGHGKRLITCYFCKPQKLRTLEGITADIPVMEAESEGLPDDIVGGSGDEDWRHPSRTARR